jgi:hypothetical protein
LVWVGVVDGLIAPIHMHALTDATDAVAVRLIDAGATAFSAEWIRAGDDRDGDHRPLAGGDRPGERVPTHGFFPHHVGVERGVSDVAQRGRPASPGGWRGGQGGEGDRDQQVIGDEPGGHRGGHGGRCAGAGV